MNPERFFCAALPDFTPLSNITLYGLVNGRPINVTRGSPAPATQFSGHKDWKFPKVPFKAKIANWRSNGKQ